MSITAIRGMSDLLGDEVLEFQGLERKLHHFFKLRHYNEIRTPALEKTELFSRAIGEGTDIVNKEMYTIEDRKGRKLTLRPELTASVVRAAIENKLLNPDEISRFYYFGAMYRAERPQAGRRRQFHQIGVETFGKASSHLDAEIISLIHDFLLLLGFEKTDFTIKINTIGTQESRKKYNEAFKAYLKPFQAQLPDDDKARIETNILRILDSKHKETQKICEGAPLLSDYLTQEDQDYFESVKQALTDSGIAFEVCSNLVRGLDYYQHTVFEVVSDLLGAQDAIGAGGRYDRLVSQLGGPKMGGIGFAMGVERLLLCAEAKKISFREEDSQSLVFLVHSNSNPSKSTILNLMRELSQKEIPVNCDWSKESIKSQLRLANKLQARFVIIAGDDELEKGEVSLKNMNQNEQQSIKLEKVVQKICELTKEEKNVTNA